MLPGVCPRRWMKETAASPKVSTSPCLTRWPTGTGSPAAAAGGASPPPPRGLGEGRPVPGPDPGPDRARQPVRAGGVRYPLRAGVLLHLSERLPVIGVLVRGHDPADRRIADQRSEER